MVSAKTEHKTIGEKRTGVNYVERKAVRAIIQNDKHEIIIIHAKNENYYKLPGGGIEADEEHIPAVSREAMEETGCQISIDGGCFAKVEEWRQDLHQISYCYFATLIKDTGSLALTEDEVQDGLQHEWISLRTAVSTMNAARPTSELGKSIKERDLYFVETFLNERDHERERLTA